MHIEPYLFFNGRCNEAIEFYRTALGAEVEMLMRFKDSPDQESCPPGVDPEQVMHANLRIGDTVVMLSDGCEDGKADYKGFSLSLGVANVAEAERLFAALSEEGEVQMPLAKTFWSPGFGMVRDRFGVSWMVNVVVEPPEV